jgi:hypothetical protein
MSWRYRKSKKSRKYIRPYQSKYFFSEKDIDFTTEYFDYNQFILQEFFSTEIEIRQKMSQFYIEEYGSRSFAYLQRKYSEWANGDYHLTDLMKERILSVMPKFLNEQAKHKLGIHEFMTSIKNTIKSFQANQKTAYGNRFQLKQPQEIVSIFEKEYEKIQFLTIQNFRFNVLTDEEKEEALAISKYILEIKLQKTFDQIESDFNTFLPFMFKFKRGIFSASYSISDLNLKVDITNTGISDIEIPKFNIRKLEANGRFKEFSDKFLAYELVTMSIEAKRSVSNSFLNSNDIKLFLDHYCELSNGESEVAMNSTFQGEGGVLLLKAQMKPMKLLKTSIVLSSIKLAIYLIVVLILVFLIINYKLFTLLLIGGFFVGIYVFSLMNEELKQVKSLRKELKTYGQ